MIRFISGLLLGLAIAIGVVAFVYEDVANVETAIRFKNVSGIDWLEFMQAKITCQEQTKEQCFAVGGFVPETMIELYKEMRAAPKAGGIPL